MSDLALRRNLEYARKPDLVTDIIVPRSKTLSHQVTSKLSPDSMVRHIVQSGSGQATVTLDPARPDPKGRARKGSGQRKSKKGQAKGQTET